MSTHLLSAYLFLSACSDYTLQESEKYSPGSQPQIEVTPSSLYFSLTEISSPAIEFFRISNIGDAELLISEITLANAGDIDGK